MPAKTFIFLSALIISGCSNKPREVTASVPLVSFSQDKPNKKEIPLQYWSRLADPLERQIQHNRYQIQLSELYLSALGLQCRELIFTDKKNKIEKRIACEIPFVNENNKQDKAWFIEKQIIESSGYVEL
ncbi:hypothetical protein [Psychromonas hadalis]|uniref:hypothetical protein n=1 Tax=Psychromonas hadalis TaxID=211669 RepID=UPI0003B6F37A|nr:hypothetical protein [Psychromonas hadalis]